MTHFLNLTNQLSTDPVLMQYTHIMNLTIANDLLNTARYLPSPHCDERPADMPIDMIVIHNISLPPKQFGTQDIENFFCGTLDVASHPYFATIAHLRVSAHLLIDRQGEVIQFVPFRARAWHAGQSSFQGQERCNDFSIGIELEGADDVSFEPIQYQTLATIINELMHHYPAIRRDRIVGHSEIAPGRKTDPGPHFDWNHLDGILTAIQTGLLQRDCL